MSLGKWFLSTALVVSSASFLIAAADEPTAPTTQPTPKVTRMGRLTRPWSLIKTLTPEQKTEIEKIHADTLEERKKIEAKEKDDIMALLTPAQVAELTAAEAALKKPATEPSK